MIYWLFQRLCEAGGKKAKNWKPDDNEYTTQELQMLPLVEAPRNSTSAPK